MEVGQELLKRRASVIALALAGLLALIGALAAPAGAATTKPASCPSFHVLHDDRIGPAVLPAGNYAIVPAAGLSCGEASQLFTRFLSDWDGNLPAPWRVVAEGSGKARFVRGNATGFSVSRSGGSAGGEGSGSSALGRVCPDRFTVNAGSDVGPLFFAKGQYQLLLPSGSGITCRRAAVLFTRFLAAPDGTLPFPWRLRNQTATFYKPENPTRSSFRVDPVAGASAA